MSRRAKGQPASGKRKPTPVTSIAEAARLPSQKSLWSEPWRTVSIGLVLAGLVWLVFGQTLQHEFLNCDDDIYVTDNSKVWSGWTSEGVRWAFQNLQAG